MNRLIINDYPDERETKVEATLHHDEKINKVVLSLKLREPIGDEAATYLTGFDIQDNMIEIRLVGSEIEKLEALITTNENKRIELLEELVNKMENLLKQYEEVVNNYDKKASSLITKIDELEVINKRKKQT